MKQQFKKLIFGQGTHLRKILFGKARGIKMNIDVQHKLQRIIGADEREIQNDFVAFSKKCNHFFDIGASDAYYGLFYKKYNPAGEAFLFDADKRFEEIQKEHLRINNIDKGVNLYQKYVSNINDDTHLTLDSLNIKSQNVFIKIDVDGAELIVLEGIKEMLKLNNCFLIVETHAFSLEKDCIAFLNTLGYKSKIIKNAWWRIILPEQRPIEHNRWFKSSK